MSASPLQPSRPLPEGRARSVSIIVPAAGALGASLHTQIDAVLLQVSPARFEVVVVDNGLAPADRSALVRRCQADDRLRRVDATARPGANHARNVGARAASGELLVFCDADDELQPGALAALIDTSDQAHLLAGALDVSGNSRAAQLARGFPDGVVTPDTEGGACYSALLAVWRETLESVGGWDETLVGGAEDIDLLQRVRRGGWSVIAVPTAVVRYELRDRPFEVFRQMRRYAYESARVRRRNAEPQRGGRDLGRTAMWLGTKGLRDLTRDITRLRWFAVAGRLVGDVSGRFARS